MLEAPQLPVSKSQEHLNKGVKPIIACLGSYDDFGAGGIVSLINTLHSSSAGLNDVHNVNFYDSVSTNAEKRFLGGGRTWTISTIDDLDKFSDRFYDCTGLIVTGRDKVTGKNISFLSHQDPTQFLKTEKRKFSSHLKDRLMEILDKCEKGTIDAVVVGGKYPEDDENDFTHSNGRIRQNYLDSIKFLSGEVQQALGFEPVVINGPKIDAYDYDVAYYDNENRRLYFVRKKVNPDTGSFLVSEVDKEKGKWK